MKKIRYWAGNVIHLLFICFLGIFALKATFCVGYYESGDNFCGYIRYALSEAGINEIFTFIGSLAFILFGVVGIYEFAYANGLSYLAPPLFIEHKNKSIIKQAERMMELYYQKDIEFIKGYENERTEFLLQALGIEEKQFRHINYEIIKARAMPDRCIRDLKLKAAKILVQKDFVIDQSFLEASKRVYDKVDYFLNLYTAFYDVRLCQDAGSIMSRYLNLSLKEGIQSIDYIVIPAGSNFLLGLEVGKLLHKPVISILDKERIYKGVFWDGDYDKSRHNHIVVIHDVLVSGKRIYESFEILPPNTYTLVGVYCLFRYVHEEFNPINDLRIHGVEENQVNCLLKVDENILKKINMGVSEDQNFYESMFNV